MIFSQSFPFYTPLDTTCRAPFFSLIVVLSSRLPIPLYGYYTIPPPKRRLLLFFFRGGSMLFLPSFSLDGIFCILSPKYSCQFFGPKFPLMALLSWSSDAGLRIDAQEELSFNKFFPAFWICPPFLFFLLKISPSYFEISFFRLFCDRVSFFSYKEEHRFLSDLSVHFSTSFPAIEFFFSHGLIFYVSLASGCCFFPRVFPPGRKRPFPLNT